MVHSLKDEISRVAHELYEKSGRIAGNDLQNWLTAEKIVYFNRMMARTVNGSALTLLEYKPADRRRASPSSRILKSPSSGKVHKVRSRQAV
jgi:hypothetical protein